MDKRQDILLHMDSHLVDAFGKMERHSFPINVQHYSVQAEMTKFYFHVPEFRCNFLWLVEWDHNSKPSIASRSINEMNQFYHTHSAQNNYTILFLR